MPHSIVINDANIKMKEFDEGLKTAIQGFEKNHFAFMRVNGSKLSEEKNILKLREFQETSKILAQHIYDYFVESSEQTPNATVQEIVEDIKEAKEEEVIATPTPTPPPTPTPNAEPKVQATTQTAPPTKNVNRNEDALAKIFASGKVDNINENDLINAGFDTGWDSPLSSRGCTCGAYTLSKGKFESRFKLTKNS